MIALRCALFAGVVSLLVACRSSPREGGPEPRASEARAPAAAPPATPSGVRWIATADGTVEFRGMCDASGAVRASGSKIVVANDDDNLLRVYDAVQGGEPLAVADLSAFVGGDSKSREAGEAREEADIEGAALAFGKAFFITSHARGDKGKKDESLSRFFAVTLDESGIAAPAGVSYADFRRDLFAAPSLASFKLKKAAKIDPEEAGGLNIEGLALAPGGRELLVGFRNPLSGVRALVAPLVNADRVATSAAHAEFGTPWELELGGRGVRDLAAFGPQVLVVAGPSAKSGDFRLFVWDVAGSVAAVEGAPLGDLTPEAAVVFEPEGRVLLLSDDGDRPIDGYRCGKTKPESARRFRGLWLRISRT